MRTGGEENEKKTTIINTYTCNAIFIAFLLAYYHGGCFDIRWKYIKRKNQEHNNFNSKFKRNLTRCSKDG